MLVVALILIRVVVLVRSLALSISATKPRHPFDHAFLVLFASKCNMVYKVSNIIRKAEWFINELICIKHFMPSVEFVRKYLP